MKPGHVMQQRPAPTSPPEPSHGTSIPEVTTILSPVALGKLRRAYNRAPDQVAEVSRQTIAGMYSRSSDLLAEMMSEFFVNPSFARDREQIVIALMAVRMGNRRMYLALHFYWGMMVGLSPAEIAHRLLFVSFYSGIDTLTASLETFSQMLTALERHVAEAGSEEDLAPRVILRLLKTLFP